MNKNEKLAKEKDGLIGNELDLINEIRNRKGKIIYR